MIKSALIFGYGSIGSRHASILKKNFKLNKIYIFTKKKIQGFTVIKKLQNIKKLKIDYFVIASPTSKHLKNLEFIEKNFKNKKILVEKPLFHRDIKKNFKKNKIYVGYNLRFNNLIRYVKDFIKGKKIIDIKITCNSYLPNWRPKKNYTKTSSASKLLGGGVILELSHELDYIRWLFGDFKIKFIDFGKCSNLKINTEDYLKLFGKIKNTNLSVDLNYYSRINKRTIYIDGLDFSLLADLISGELTINNKGKIFSKKFSQEKNDSYIKQHRNILINKGTQVCSFIFAKQTMSFIENIKKWKKRN